MTLRMRVADALIDSANDDGRGHICMAQADAAVAVVLAYARSVVTEHAKRHGANGLRELLDSLDEEAGT